MANHKYSFWTPDAAHISGAIALYPTFYLFGVLATENGSEGYTIAETLPAPVVPFYYAIATIVAVTAVPVALVSFVLMLPFTLLHDAVIALGRCIVGTEEDNANNKIF
jgi:hypothetical protein